MKQVIRIGGIASVFCIVAVAHGEGASTAAETGWARMTQCAAIGDDKARHTCTDDALREAGLLTEEAKATAKRKSFGLQKAAPLAAAAAPPAPTSAASASAPSGTEALNRRAAEKKDAGEHLEVTLAKVDHGGDGKLVLTTIDGAVWHQVESDAVRQVPKQGEVMKIETRSLGGFMCQPSKYVSFRCYRSK